MGAESIVKTYESPQLNRVLEETLHPGGPGLTQRMGEVAGIERASRILDVGCGRGNAVLYFSKRTGCRAVGVDLSTASIAIALERCAAQGMSEQAHFTAAGACQLPCAPAEFDVVLSECTLSLVPDKAGAFREMVRVLKPGGRIVISDIVLKHRLSAPFKRELGFVCCFSEALTFEGYQDLAAQAGLEPMLAQDHSLALKQTAFRVSQGYGSLDEFWSQFGQGVLPCCNPDSISSQSASAGVGWRELFKQGKPGYWLLAWRKPGW